MYIPYALGDGQEEGPASWPAAPAAPIVRSVPPRKTKPKPNSAGLEPNEVADDSPPAALTKLGDEVAAAGGHVLASYRDPLGGHWLSLAVLPIDRVEPTPFQRELSDAHAKRLVGVIPKVGRFLDPLIAVRGESGGFWTPNGMHRLEAMRRLGARSIVVLLVPEVELAYRILALNTEKAHNLKDKSLEVVRMADALVADPAQARRPESDWAFEFEEPGYLTIGRVYQERPRYSGGAYMPVVRRCEAFLDKPLKAAVPIRAERAARLMELDDLVGELVGKLKAAGLKSAYLKPFVVARLNPLRFVPAPRGKEARAARAPDFDKTIDQMIDKGKKFDASKVKPQDLAAMGGPPPEPE
jgi:ParB family transcriptional regulator, chromosome partitioning protein